MGYCELSGSFYFNFQGSVTLVVWLMYRTHLAPFETHLVYLGCAILLDGRKFAKQTKLLPISAKHRQPCLMKGGQTGVGRGTKRVSVQYFNFN